MIGKMSRKTCRVCQNTFPSAASGKYCYLHRQIYDSLIAEFDAVKKTSKEYYWKKFLSEKRNSERYLPKELGDVIKTELDST